MKYSVKNSTLAQKPGGGEPPDEERDEGGGRGAGVWGCCGVGVLEGPPPGLCEGLRA